MQALWSPRHRFESWRRLWVALAQAQHELGLGVTKAQVDALRAAVPMTADDFRRAAEHESRLRHDVMAHVHAFGDRVPSARGVIHLGMTSQDINCNAETPIIASSLDLIAAKLARVIADLGRFAERFADLPALGFTHYQPAQPTTVGKRAAMWGNDLVLGLERVEFTRSSLRLRGLKGATGTQASFLALLNGDEQRVDELERRFVAAIGWPGDRLHAFTGQTYPRVSDSHVLNELASVAASIHKVCNDLRLLCSRREVDEPFETSQIGSSAMPYKRNPMRCERTTGLCRIVMSLASAGTDTAATQWLERTLDDSSARRVAIPEAFLALDGALDTMHNVCAGLVVHEASVRRNLQEELPFMATEVILMEAARLGRDRQDAHEAIRRHAQEAGMRVKQEGLSNDLIERLRAEPILVGVDLDAALDPSRHIGRAPSQARAFAKAAAEIAARFRHQISALGEVSLKV